MNAKELLSFQVFGLYADSRDWEPLGVWRLQLTPTIGETIIADVDDHAHAFRVVGVHHPEGRTTTDPGDIFAVHVGTDLDDRKRMLKSFRSEASPNPPHREGPLLAPGYRSADDDSLPF